MFAQYNQHYQQQGGAAVSTSGMVWNGSAWVAAGRGQVAPTGGHSTYSTGSYGAQAAAEQPSALVTKYTEYYHQWTARAKQHEERAQRLPPNSPQRSEADSHVQWSKYYADSSSRAAHHFHNTPHTPPTFELPPAPPAAGQQQPQPQPQAVQQQSSAKNNSRWDAEPQKASDSDGPPDGLKRYVHRCLQQCTNPEQTKAVERETERVIAKALQNGTLHTTNWDSAPLIPISGAKRDFASPAQHGHPQSSKKQKLVSSNDSYYGPGGGAGQHGGQGQSGGGYYGPSSSSPRSNNGTHTPPRNSYHQPPSQQQQHSKYQHGHYGYENNNQDFIAVPQFGKKNGKKSNKYVNPNSTKSVLSCADDGFKRSTDALAKRANRFSGAGGNASVRNAKAKGIDDRYLGKGIIGGNKQLDENDYEHMKVKGTCMKLEKQYLRLTAPPKAELVRPLEILQQHLKNLKAEWKFEKKRDYLWFCSEMKSMRQDLTVQHISNALTVEVYEFHARIALQEADLNEFNQAQTQLRILYDDLDDPKALENQNEFVAYLVIYFVMLSLNKKYTGGSSDILNLMLSLTPSQRADSAIQHALEVRASIAEIIDYHKFFRLYASCPNLGGKLMDLMVPTVRHWSLQRICGACRPTVEVVYVLNGLGLKTAEPQDVEEGRRFLLSCGCVLSEDGKDIKTKESVVRESDLQEKRSLI